MGTKKGQVRKTARRAYTKSRHKEWALFQIESEQKSIRNSNKRIKSLKDFVKKLK